MFSGVKEVCYIEKITRVGESAAGFLSPGFLLKKLCLYTLVIVPGNVFSSGISHGKARDIPSQKKARSGKHLTATTSHSQAPKNFFHSEILSEEDRYLEEQAWTCADNEIFETERKVITRLQSNPYSAFYHYLLSHIYFRIYTLSPGRMDLLRKSGELAEQAIAIAPEKTFGYLAMADLMEMAGKPKDAEQFLAQARLKAPHAPYDWRISFAQARAGVEREGSLPVLKYLEKSLQMPQASKSIILPFAATIIEAQSDSLESQRLLQDWIKKYPHPLLEIMQAINYTERGLYAKARKTYASVLKKNPDNIESQVNYAVLDYRYLNQTEKSRKTFLSLLKKKNLNAEVWSVLHAHLGSIALENRSFAMARKYFVEAVRTSPQKSMTVDFLLNNYTVGHDYKALISVIEEIIEELPGVPDLHAISAEIYSGKLGDFKNSVRHLQNAVILDSENSDYYSALGLSHYHLKEFGPALAAFEEATTLKPDDALSFYNKACVLALMNDTEKSLKALDRAIILNPHLQRLALADKDFEAIRHLSAFRFVTRERGWTSIENSIPLLPESLLFESPKPAP